MEEPNTIEDRGDHYGCTGCALTREKCANGCGVLAPVNRARGRYWCPICMTTWTITVMPMPSPAD